jgi:hypothetical protein
MTTPFTARLAAFVAALGVTFALLAGAGHLQIPASGTSAAAQLAQAQSSASSAHAG